MTIYEDLIYFLKNGRLEHINFGIAGEELIENLGEPELKSPVRNSSFVYYYNNFEFIFFQEEWKGKRTERLVCIILNHPRTYSKKSNLQIKSYNWRTNLTLGKGLEFLNKNNIKFEEVQYSLDEDWRQIKTEGGVTIWFVNLEEKSPSFTFSKMSNEVSLLPLRPPTK